MLKEQITQHIFSTKYFLHHNPSLSDVKKKKDLNAYTWSSFQGSKMEQSYIKQNDDDDDCSFYNDRGISSSSSSM